MPTGIALTRPSADRSLASSPSCQLGCRSQNYRGCSDAQQDDARLRKKVKYNIFTPVFACKVMMETCILLKKNYWAGFCTTFPLTSCIPPINLIHILGPQQQISFPAMIIAVRTFRTAPVTGLNLCLC